jgi:ribonucleoside-diphosphate reductase alpha chain
MSELKKTFPKIYELFGGDEYRSSVLINKYLLRDRLGNFIEHSAEEVCNRVSKVLAAHTDYPEYWQAVYKEAIANFKGVVPQGSILAAAGNDEYLQSLSNCFVVPSPADTMAGIMRSNEMLAQIFKRRGGVGVDLSTLRPDGSIVKNAALKSSGAWGWADHYSNTCRDVAQAGRRGALMLTISIKHPDASKWATMKADLKKVTGANVSIFITDEFMQAVKEDGDFVQQFPIDSKEPIIKQTIKARELWDVICKQAHSTAEPGLLMWDNIISTLPAHCYDQFKVSSTNPCSEIPLSPHDSCRLITICLTNYLQDEFTSTASFDFDKFEKDIRTCVRMGESLVDAELVQVRKIIEKVSNERDKAPTDLKADFDLEIDLWTKIQSAAVNGRRLGLGDHGLGDCLTKLGLKYDSDEAIAFAGKLKRFYRDVAYDESVELAIEKGAFPSWDPKLEESCKFFDTFPQELKDKMLKYGRRHISLLTNAPTGSISTLSGTSSGIEPSFRFCYFRRRKLNPSDVNARVDFVDDTGDKWQNYVIYENIVKEYFKSKGQPLPEVSSDVELFKVLPSYFITSDKINWIQRVKMQAELTKYTDHSLSSTINLPEDVSVEEVKNIYMEAWKSGCKGITIYRDNCRSGVLITAEQAASKKEKGRPETLIRQEAPARPKSLPCEVSIATVEGKEYVVIVSFLGDSIYEVFAGEHNNCLPEVKFSGEITKKKEGVYLLKYSYKGEDKEIDINKYFKNPKYGAITRLVSTALRHGTPIAFIVEQLQKSSDAFTGFEKSLARVLKRYSKKEDVARKVLANAGLQDIEVKFEDGCMTIINHTKGTIESKCD